MRILIRVALWPVRMALTVLEWALLFVTHFVGIGFGFFAVPMVGEQIFQTVYIVRNLGYRQG